MKYDFIFGLVLCVLKLNECFPNNSTVVSKYAKVAVWGSNKTDSHSRQDGRNSKSNNIWNHRLDPKSIQPTTKKKNPSVAYQYPVYQGPESKVGKRIEHVPGIGEVIVAQPEAQDRFEARPLFAYRNKFASATYIPPPAPKPNPTQPPGPVAPLPSAPSPAPNNLYNSPYSSYNPPDFKPDDSIANLYPPNVPLNSDSSSLDSSAPAPPMDEQMNASSEPPKSNTPDAYASLGPPLASQGNDDSDNHDHPDHPSYKPHDYDHHAPPQDPMAMYKYQEGPPPHPPKHLDDVYYPPDFPKDQIHGHGHDIIKDPHDAGMMPPEDHGMMPPEDHGMMPPADHGMIPPEDHGMMPPEDDGMMPPEDHGMMPSDDMVDDGKAHDDDDTQDGHMDMAPPPPHAYSHGHAFPQYLYDHHHYDSHVYEEIPHTTMPPAKEDKRVSSVNYSYYYLGRKLWYIPLYFSVYFIIYITVLILKSIARHKVRLKYQWYEHDTSAKHARSMNLDDIRHEEITDLHQNVTVALKNATSKYDHVIAM